jgi:hypothetical protein
MRSLADFPAQTLYDRSQWDDTFKVHRWGHVN